MDRTPQSRFTKVAVLTALLAAVPAGIAPGHAQVGIEGFVGSITDLSVYGSCWNTAEGVRGEGDCPGERVGYGLEVIWRLKEIRLGAGPPDSVKVEWTLTEKTETLRDGGVDSVRTYEAEVTPVYDRPAVLLELGLGYGQFSGFRAEDPSLDLRGAVREIPAVALYATLQNSGFLPDWVQPYAGIRSGLIRLSDVQAYDAPATDTAAVYNAAGEAFQLGAAVGLAASWKRMSVLAEYAGNLRRFESVRWTGPGGGRLPGILPRELDFSGGVFSLGVQVGFR